MVHWLKRVQLLRKASEKELVLTFGGDMIVRRPFSQLADNGFKALLGVIRDSDVSFANLEIPLTQEESPDPEFPLPIKANPKIAEEISWAGFDVVSLANNHTMNYKAKGLRDTLQALGKHNIKIAGAGMDIKEALSPTYISAKGNKIAFISFLSHSLASIERAGIKKPGLACVRAYDVIITTPQGSPKTTIAPLAWDVQNMEETIRRVKEKADFVVVALHFHWVLDHIPDSVPEQKLVTHAAVDAGANLIVGHGPHKLRGIEVYKGKYIFYSIGNFAYQIGRELDEVTLKMLYPKRTWKLKSEEGFYQSIVPRITISKNDVTKVEVLPIQLIRHGDYRGIPKLADVEVGKAIIDHLTELSSNYGTRIVWKNWFGEIEESP